MARDASDETASYDLCRLRAPPAPRWRLQWRMEAVLSQAREPPVIAEGLFSFDIGGGERIGVNAARGFHRRGYRVLCFAMYGDDGPLRAELEAEGIRCVGLNYTKRWRPTRRLTYPLEMARFFRREAVSALHVHYGAALMIIASGAARAGIKRYVMTEHALHQYQERPDYLRATMRACRHASAVAGVHPGVVRYFIETMRLPPSKVHFVPNGVDVSLTQAPRNDELRARHGVTRDEFLYLFVGRLHPTKDLPTLLRATALVPHVRLWLVGDGAERAQLERIAKELALDQRVAFLGEQSDVTSYLRCADGFVMTSATEGLPLALLEAMAMRVPCIATTVGGIPQLLSEDAGLLVPPGDAAAAASAMQRLAAERGLRDRLRERGFARARDHYSLDHTVDRYLELLGLPKYWPPATSTAL